MNANTSGSDTAGNVWLRPAKARRATAPLSPERIAGEAVELLDEEGIGGLTMRRLAERLGTGSTTLYWHVKTKDDVLDLALDTIFAAVPLPAAARERAGSSAPANDGAPPSGGHGGSWRDEITLLINGWRAVLLAHPWSTAALGRPLLGPNVLGRTEFLHATLAGAGFREPHLTAAAYGLFNYVIGSTVMQVIAQAGDEARTREATARHLRENADRYPTLAAMDPTAADWDTTFALGLGYLLDGMAGPGPHSPAPPRG
ncbi:TetR family transcriptional regulator [Sphaerisporangium siamense]|uniref:AcrR family transcriptional regulator n=1 Tax=Sphaerisporangium siamense TaxID=795645 RepID=A0A7W7GDK0_9ACTN|nr:TetR/AcrR family transcriptional regulator C-terminal domain-containing protein [Sphaerisporangium siamense]MBB4704619.1 AcrR family transcriptional regulator [Sphaerisporangium siamense]GII86233.1 TetR family transcriptional regulator [Sphaerisporangium siamense]